MLEHTTESISSRVRPHKTGLVNIVSQEPGFLQKNDPAPETAPRDVLDRSRMFPSVPRGSPSAIVCSRGSRFSSWNSVFSAFPVFPTLSSHWSRHGGRRTLRADWPAGGVTTSLSLGHVTSGPPCWTVWCRLSDRRRSGPAIFRRFFRAVSKNGPRNVGRSVGEGAGRGLRPVLRPPGCRGPRIRTEMFEFWFSRPRIPVSI